MPSLEIIVAVDPAGGFGRQGEIPWKCKEDMKRFANISKDIKVCVMGKTTYLDMLKMKGNGKDVLEKVKKNGILPKRQSYVISSTLSQEDCPGATIVPDLQAVRNLFHNTDQRIAVIGGEKLYIQALASASKIHLTVMDKHYGCDRFFPVERLTKSFTIVKDQSRMIQTDVDGKTETVRFVTYERLPGK